jgi:hypothetical protein
MDKNFEYLPELSAKHNEIHRKLWMALKVEEIEDDVDTINSDIESLQTDVSTKADKGANTDITSLTGLTGDVYNTAWSNDSVTTDGWSSFVTVEIYHKK